MQKVCLESSYISRLQSLFIFSLWQIVPFPLKPSLHEHSYEPSTFVQLPWSGSQSLVSEHSSISVRNSHHWKGIAGTDEIVAHSTTTGCEKYFYNTSQFCWYRMFRNWEYRFQYNRYLNNWFQFHDIQGHKRTWTIHWYLYKSRYHGSRESELHTRWYLKTWWIAIGMELSVWKLRHFLLLRKTLFTFNVDENRV